MLGSEGADRVRVAAFVSARSTCRVGPDAAEGCGGEEDGLDEPWTGDRGWCNGFEICDAGFEVFDNAEETGGGAVRSRGGGGGGGACEAGF